VADTLIPDLLDLEEARRSPMAMKDCSDEFKADVVDVLHTGGVLSAAAGGLPRTKWCSGPPPSCVAVPVTVPAEDRHRISLGPA
jgi:hypothetical protein